MPDEMELGTNELAQHLATARRIQANVNESLELIKDVPNFANNWTEAGSLAVYLRTATVAADNLVNRLANQYRKDNHENPPTDPHSS